MVDMAAAEGVAISAMLAVGLRWEAGTRRFPILSHEIRLVRVD